MKRMQAALACVALALFLGACGGGDGVSEGDGDPAQPDGGGQAASSENGGSAGEDQYARGQYDITEDGAADDQYEDAAPEDLPFPLPPDADVVLAAQGPETAYAAVVNVPSGEEAYEFYLQALPDAGFEIIRDDRVQTPPEGPQGEGAEGGAGDVPFSAVLVVEGDDLRGALRFDEERTIIGMSAAEQEQSSASGTSEGEAAPDAEKDTPDQ